MNNKASVASRSVIDIVIPAYNEALSIGKTLEAVIARFDGSRYSPHLIVIDDGSNDGTALAVKGYLSRYPLTLVSLSRNFGKESALLAGLDHSRGAATILMDADLQHPPELIDEFIARWEAGYECVYGIRQDRHDESLAKRLLTRIFYLGINRGASVRVVPDALDFRLLDRKVVQTLRSMRERVRFTKGLYAWLGFRSSGVPFVPSPRANGSSHFGRGALFRLGWDGLTSFSDFPLRACIAIGMFIAFAAVSYAGFIAARTILFGADVEGWPTLVDAIMLLGGLQILFLGVVGQYVRNVFIETKQRPNYIVRERLDSASVVGARSGERDFGLRPDGNGEPRANSVSGHASAA